jgi:hypothetical protein
MRADVQHAGCGGTIIALHGTIACSRCRTRITDPRELKPHGGWTPTAADKQRHVYPDIEDLLGNAGALA